MGSLTSLLLIFLPIFATALGAESKNSRLRKAVFANYDKLVIPDHKITLNLSMTVYYLSYCPHKQVFEINGYLAVLWIDNRLAWNPEDHDGINKLQVPADQIWIPDITLLNAAEATESTYIDWKSSPPVYIASNGYVLTGPHLKLKSFCKLSEEWPWGQQNCTASLGSWVYDETALDIHAGLKSFKWDGINLKWLLDERIKITSTTASRTPATYECCPNEVYPRIDLNFKFQYVQRMEGMKIIKPDNENEVDDD